MLLALGAPGAAAGAIFQKLDLTGPDLQPVAAAPSDAFWLCAGLSAFTFVFIWRIVPETRRKSLEEIERMRQPPIAATE